MNRLGSLRAKINLIFAVSLILLVLFFGLLYTSTRHRNLQEIEMQERANIHYLYLYYLKYGRIDTDYLASQNIRVIDAGTQDLKIKNLLEGSRSKKKFAVIHARRHRYILINNDRFRLILENLNRPRFPLELVLSFLGALGLIVLLYLWILRSIRPLFELKEKILRFSEGDLNVRFHSDRDDEIAEVANAFDDAVRKIRDLLHARQLLLRAIMHELKTPIAKGRLMAEMIEDPQRRQRFHAIFERLNRLIDDFAQIERITSGTFSPHLRPYKLSDLSEASIDMLMLDDPERHVQVVVRRDRTVEADFELFTLALKNLVDNAVKYSPDHQARILIEDRELTVSNRGEALSEPIEHYFAPFHSSRSGLGLGLYIVKSILDIHHMNLLYRHEKGVNYFTIVLDR